jgi:ribosomal-protein-alanine N-acetyltransferase
MTRESSECKGLERMGEKSRGNVREFRMADIHDLLEIEREAFPKSGYPKEVIIDYASKYPDSFIVLETGDEIAGYLIYDRGGHIFSMAVKPLHRRKGFGRRMFAHARDHAEKKLWLEVRSKNTGAIRFYEAMGMTIRGRVPRYYETDDAFIMVLDGKVKRVKESA